MPLDLFESDEAYTALLDVPGVAAEDIEVTVHDGVLQVLAERKSAVDEKDAKPTGLRCERTSERMHRSLRLSARVTAESVYARLESGVIRVEALRVEVLRVEVPKAEESRPRRVAVQKG